MEHEPPVAVVLASTKGLGYASALALARSGYQVVVSGRTNAGVDEAVERLRGEGLSAAGIVADVCDAAAIDRLFETVDERYGRLGALITNCGGPERGSFAELDDDAWYRAVNLVLMSVVRSVRHAAPRMEAAGDGRIVVIGSSSVRRPLPAMTLSNALRGGLLGLVRSLAPEVAGRGVTVNLVAPGRFETQRLIEGEQRMAARTGQDLTELRRAGEARVPAGRYGQPDELGSLVAYLCSPEAAYITGQDLLIDGGLVTAGA